MYESRRENEFGRLAADCLMHFGISSYCSLLSKFYPRKKSPKKSETKQNKQKNIGPLDGKREKNLPAGNSQRTNYYATIGRRASVVACQFVRL